MEERLYTEGLLKRFLMDKMQFYMCNLKPQCWRFSSGFFFFLFLLILPFSHSTAAEAEATVQRERRGEEAQTAQSPQRSKLFLLLFLLVSLSPACCLLGPLRLVVYQTSKSQRSYLCVCSYAAWWLLPGASLGLPKLGWVKWTWLNLFTFKDNSWFTDDACC